MASDSWSTSSTVNHKNMYLRERIIIYYYFSLTLHASTKSTPARRRRNTHEYVFRTVPSTERLNREIIRPAHFWCLFFRLIRICKNQPSAVRLIRRKLPYKSAPTLADGKTSARESKNTERTRCYNYYFYYNIYYMPAPTALLHW